MPKIRGSGLFVGLGALLTDGETLAAGNARILPAGELVVSLGRYSFLQIYDPVTTTWKIIPRTNDGMTFVDSDGANYRIINMSGCAVGAMVTNHGSSYATTTTVTSSAGNSLWKPVIGGMVATSQTVVSGGSGYTYPPRVVIPAPAAPGIPATGHCTLSGGVVNSLVIDNQGGGYVGTVLAMFVTDPRDPSTTIVPATAVTLTLTGTGQIAGIFCLDPGSAVTSVPTLTITDPTGAGSSGAATALMNFSVTGYTVSGGGSFAAGTFITSSGGVLTTSPANTNPAIEANIIVPRPCKLIPALSAGAIVASATTAPTVEDWGAGFQLAPTLVPVDGKGLATTAVTTVTATVGGQTDFIWVQPL